MIFALLMEFEPEVESGADTSIATQTAQDWVQNRKPVAEFNEGDLTELFANRAPLAGVKSGADRL
ncbi:MAG: hypothetical protein JNK38_06815 [Acidobacteria bacterium]|nr:hypothetical protein [Acidobacteriota bacterium]